MKKHIPLYILGLLVLGAIVTSNVLELREMRAMKAEIASIERQQRATNLEGILQVEVVNTPTVEINEPLKVAVDEPLSVNVDNEPDVNCTNCRP
jgi:hypothetical protein